MGFSVGRRVRCAYPPYTPVAPLRLFMGFFCGTAGALRLPALHTCRTFAAFYGVFLWDGGCASFTRPTHLSHLCGFFMGFFCGTAGALTLTRPTHLSHLCGFFMGFFCGTAGALRLPALHTCRTFIVGRVSEAHPPLLLYSRVGKQSAPTAYRITTFESHPPRPVNADAARGNANALQ